MPRNKVERFLICLLILQHIQRNCWVQNLKPHKTIFHIKIDNMLSVSTRIVTSISRLPFRNFIFAMKISKPLDVFYVFINMQRFSSSKEHTLIKPLMILLVLAAVQLKSHAICASSK